MRENVQNIKSFVRIFPKRLLHNGYLVLSVAGTMEFGSTLFGSGMFCTEENFRECLPEIQTAAIYIGVSSGFAYYFLPQFSAMIKNLRNPSMETMNALTKFKGVNFIWFLDNLFFNLHAAAFFHSQIQGEAAHEIYWTANFSPTLLITILTDRWLLSKMLNFFKDIYRIPEELRQNPGTARNVARAIVRPLQNVVQQEIPLQHRSDRYLTTRIWDTLSQATQSFALGHGTASAILSLTSIDPLTGGIIRWSAGGLSASAELIISGIYPRFTHESQQAPVIYWQKLIAKFAAFITFFIAIVHSLTETQENPSHQFIQDILYFTLLMLTIGSSLIGAFTASVTSQTPSASNTPENEEPGTTPTILPNPVNAASEDLSATGTEEMPDRPDEQTPLKNTGAGEALGLSKFGQFSHKKNNPICVMQNPHDTDLGLPLISLL